MPLSSQVTLFSFPSLLEKPKLRPVFHPQQPMNLPSHIQSAIDEAKKRGIPPPHPAFLMSKCIYNTPWFKMDKLVAEMKSGKVDETMHDAPIGTDKDKIQEPSLIKSPSAPNKIAPESVDNDKIQLVAESVSPRKPEPMINRKRPATNEFHVADDNKVVDSPKRFRHSTGSTKMTTSIPSIDDDDDIKEVPATPSLFLLDIPDLECFKSKKTSVSSSSVNEPMADPSTPVEIVIDDEWTNEEVQPDVPVPVVVQDIPTAPKEIGDENCMMAEVETPMENRPPNPTVKIAKSLLRSSKKEEPEKNDQLSSPIVVESDPLLVKSRPQRMEMCKFGPVFDAFPQLKENTNVFLSDFSSIVSENLEELFADNDVIWNSLGKIKNHLSPEQILECEKKFTADDSDDVRNLLYLVAFFNRTKKNAKIDRVTKLFRRMEESTPSDAMKKLRRKQQYPLVFSCSPDHSKYHLYIDSRDITVVGGLRVAILSVIAVTRLFDVYFNNQVEDLLSFFYIASGLTLDKVPKLVKGALAIIRWSLLNILHLFCLVSSKFTIDWSTCETETACYFLDQCIQGSASQYVDKLTQFSVGTLKDPDCPLGLQLKFYNNEKVLYILQVKKALTTKKIEICHGDDSILSCQEENGTVIVKSENPYVEKLKFDLYEDLSRFDSDIALCAFTVEKISTFGKIPNYRLQWSSIRFDQIKHEYFTKGLTILPNIANPILCDPDTIGDLSDKHDFRVLPVKYKARPLLDCSNYKSDLGIHYDYHLYIQHDDFEPKIVNSLECAQMDSSYQFKFNNGTDDIFITDSFVAYCAVEVSQLCTKPSFCEKQCPPFVQGDNDHVPSYNCTDGKWFINGKYYVGIQPICKPSDKNEPLFYMPFPDQPEKELTEGQCFDNYNCTIVSKLDISECHEGNIACGKIISGNQIYCEKADYELIIYTGTGSHFGDPKYECNILTGLYTSETNSSEIIPATSRVACRKEREKKSAKLSQGSVTLIGFGAVVVSALLAAGLMLCIYSIVIASRRKIVGKIQETIINQQDRWIQLGPLDKVHEAWQIFGGGDFSSDHILSALKLLDIILECETEEPDVWEAVDPFLKKFQAAALSKDRQLQKAFNRYCYLQAKKIIDKHGWISPNKVTKGNHAGYIRVCAIRLLAIARRDDVDAQKLVLEGFKALRFNAVDQYPHCGFLLALLTQQRVGTLPLQRKLIDLLQSECPKNDIPAEEQFHWFGSVKNQTYFAIGASDVCFTHNVTSRLQEISDVSLRRSFLEGTVYCTSGNTTDMSNSLFIWVKDGIVDATIEVEEAMGIKPSVEKEKKSVKRKAGKGLQDPSTVADITALIPSIKHLNDMLIMMIFQRRFRSAKDLENWYNDMYNRRLLYAEKRKAKDENRVWKESTLYESEAEKAAKRKPKTEPMRGKTPLYYDMKSTYRKYMECFENELEFLRNWLTKKIGKEEMNKLSKSSKDSASLQLNATQKKESSGSGTPIDEFIDQFVGSFLKEKHSEQRITTCPISEVDQTKFRAMLERILSEKTILGEQVLFPPEQVVEVFDTAAALFATEPVFIEDVPAGISVVGDLHGNIFDLARIFEANAADGKPGYECGKYIFLGDYCDRGPAILEIVLALFILKILYPDRFWVLRGNHEFISQNWQMGTMQEIEFAYGKFAAEFIFYKLNEAFAFMSICAVVGKEIFCAHGGISACPMTRHELRLLRKPITDTSFDVLVNDILWSDPTKGADGFFYNENRGNSIFYGEDFLEKALEELECTSIIRGHQMMSKGYAKCFPCCLIVFSASAQSALMNDAAFVRIAEDLKYEIVVLKEDKDRNQAEDDCGKVKPTKDEITMRESRDKPESGEGSGPPSDIGTGEVAESNEAE